jgi:hypothetical protein
MDKNYFLLLPVSATSSLLLDAKVNLRFQLTVKGLTN